MEKYEVDPEERAIESEMFKNKQLSRIEKDKLKGKECFVLLKLSFFLIFFFIFLLTHQDAECRQRYFPDTWTCPNPRCGYKNYEGIKNCALCGTPRPLKHHARLRS